MTHQNSRPIFGVIAAQAADIEQREICPLFFAERELGYVVLRFDHPDTFDHIFRNWLKSLANGLEFLRMKNDIRYLTECQNLAKQRDSLTGMYNQKGLQNAYASSENVQFRMVMLRIRQSGQSGDGLQESGLVYAVLDAAEAVRQFCGNHDICGRLDKDTFLCLIRSEQSVDFLTSLLSAILLQHTAYRDTFGVDSFVCEAVPCEGHSFSECVNACEQRLIQAEKELADRRLDPHYHELSQLRDMIYRKPQLTFDQENVYRLFHGSKGYLRTIYRQCYGVTLHDDCMSARIARAQYLLSVTVMNLPQIAEQCGYHDAKYLMRQFQQHTGMTAMQYRSLTK